MTIKIHVSEKIKRKIYYLEVRELNKNNPHLENKEIPGRVLYNLYRKIEKCSNGYSNITTDDIYISKELKNNIEFENDLYKRNFNIIQKTIELIIHEEIHLCLTKLESVETSRKYDNIKNGLRNSGFMA